MPDIKEFLFSVTGMLIIYNRNLKPYINDPIANLEELIMGDILNIAKCETIPGMACLLGALPDIADKNNIDRLIIDFFIKIYEDQARIILSQIDIPNSYIMHLSIRPGYILVLKMIHYNNNKQVENNKFTINKPISRKPTLTIRDDKVVFKYT